jgi:hypothetical protein
MHRVGCQREDHPHIGRRELLQAGALGLFGAGLADLLRPEARAVQPRSCISVRWIARGDPVLPR